MQTTVVLAGGGHSHALFLRMLGMNPLPGVRVVLVSDVSHAAYSGMLPGLIAGLYSFDDAHIDLRRLARFAGAEFILASITQIDPVKRLVGFADRPALPYDLLSLNLGSVPAAVPGVEQYAIPVKPVSRFLSSWQDILERHRRREPLAPIIVGGGAGGVELAFSLRTALGPDVPVRLVEQSSSLLPSHSRRTRGLIEVELRRQRIEPVLGRAVEEVLPGRICFQHGGEIEGSPIIWAGRAAPPPCLADTALALDECGFVAIDSTLRSISHDTVFATGDTASFVSVTPPKSGVYAVRQAKPLFHNIRRQLRGKPLVSYRPQRHALALIGTGSDVAIASRGPFAAKSSLLWRFKQHLDLKFMDRFARLPAMNQEEGGNGSAGENAMRCLGCAAKLSESSLARTLDRVSAAHPKVFSPAELNQLDDAAVVGRGNSPLLQTIDYLPALVSDDFVFGRIAAAHCMSDIAAMGGVPNGVLAALIVPYAAKPIMEDRLYQLLAGICRTLEQSSVPLLGGHSAEGERVAVAMTCNGTVDRARLLQTRAPRGEYALILTKPIGTGVLFAAEMQLQAKGRWIDAALEFMVQPNCEAGKIFASFPAAACTDVTGFGLAGHLLRMLRGSGCTARIALDAIPCLAGSCELSERGIRSSLFPENSRTAHAIRGSDSKRESARYPLLFDPQTSGGLLAAVAHTDVEECIRRLRAGGYRDTAVIGELGLGEREEGIELI